MHKSREIAQALSELWRLYDELLYQEVAERLARRSVIFEFVDERLLPDARAAALRQADTGIIQVRDDLEPEQALKSYLHEVAHLREHFGYLQDMSRRASVAAPVLSPVLKHLRSTVSDSREREAVELSERWYRYAQEHGSGSIRSKLLALLEMSDRDIHGVTHERVISS